jgi:hypothetical protein
MDSSTELKTLASLAALPYLNDAGELPESLQSKVGVYAIFDQSHTLQFIGYSRDVYLSLKQHLVRQPMHCYWVKAVTIERPSRAVLEEIRTAWLTETGAFLTDSEAWTDPIQVIHLMTPDEQANYANPMHDEMTQRKILKAIARRVEADILAQLKQRGVQTEIRFNPKLKEEGLLDLK